MKRISSILFFAFVGLCFTGCSVPRVATYGHIKSITREEIKPKGMFGEADIVSINDFRKSEKYDEDIDALKEKVEKYIATHADLSGTAKNNLRELKVASGSSKEEIELLMGEPDKIIKPGSATQTASEIWIYTIKKMDAFTVFIIPLFFTRQSYYLYFAGNTLTNIERHYLEQLLESTSPATQSDFDKK